MDYKKQYDALIYRGLNRKLEEYSEKHHILPRCMGGDDEDNIVRLTPREHFIAHILLVKIYPNQQGLINAVQMMCIGHDVYRLNNRMYGWLKEKFAIRMSESQRGEGNSQFGTMWIHNLELKQSKKIQKDRYNEYLVLGWIKGRKMKFSKTAKEISIENTKQAKIAFETKRSEETNILFTNYMDSDYTSLNSFAKDNVSFSLVTLTKRFKKYVVGYSEVSSQGMQDKSRFLELVA